MRPTARCPAAPRRCCSWTSTPAWAPGIPAASLLSSESSSGAFRSGPCARFDGGAEDLEAEALRHAAMLDEAPIDLAVLGLGRDGHVAFDEPPARRASGVQVVRLAHDTRADAAAAFGGIGHVPARALTTGLGTLYRARELILVVTGSAKAPALRAMLEDPVGPSCPASLLRDHPRLTVVCDREAAALLAPRPSFTSHRVLVVLGHRAPGSAQSTGSPPSRARGCAVRWRWHIAVRSAR